MNERTQKKGLKILKSHYDAHVGRGAKRFHTMIPLEFQDIELNRFQPEDRIDPYDRQVYVEESVDISLREADYQRLLDVLVHWQERGFISLYSKHLERTLAFEQNLREKHPAVKNAYEQYQVLLKMVANGEIND